MIRLILALLATMFVTFTIAGTDRGQVRYGLMTTGNPAIAAQTVTPQSVVTASAPVAIEAPAAEAVVEAVYVPAQPLILTPEAPAEPAVETSTATVLAEPEALVRFVAVATANVREGPSKDFAVIDKLARGEAVAVVSATTGPDGWTLIRIEGDGLEGYVSNALLADQP